MADYDVPDNLHYSEQDEWARPERDRVVVGVTDYAQQQLGDIVFVELPEVGTAVEKGEPFGVVESVKAVSDLCAPVSGEVIEINEDLREHPELANEDCYGDGWIIAIAPSEPKDLGSLLDAKSYRKHIEARSG